MKNRPGRPAAAVCGLASMALIGLSACSNTEGGGSAAGGEDCTEFTYWSMWQKGEAMQEVLAKAISDFESETDATVDVQWQGRDNLQRMVPTLNTDTVPDLVDGSYVNISPALVATQQAHGLKDAYSTEVGGTPVDQVIPAKYLESIDIELEDGQPWMLPYTLSSDAIWFNAKDHPELVESPPETWEEFIALLDELKADGETPIALDGDVPGYNAYWLNTLILRNAGPGSLYETSADESGKAWKDDAVLDAADKVQQLVDGGYFIDGYNGSKFPTQQQKWAAGDAALLFMGSWAPTETTPYATEGFEYDSFPFPTTTGEYNSARADFTGFAVPKKAQCAELAQEFAAHSLDEKYQKMAVEAGMLQIREGIDPAPQQESVWEHLQSADSFHQQNDGVAFPGYRTTVFEPIDDDLVLGNIDAQKFVDQMSKDSANYWKQQG